MGAMFNLANWRVNEMLQILSEFRKRLDDIMLQAMHSRVLLYGYESYTGRFIKWYAEYYHGIKIDYLLSTNTTRNGAYSQEIFRPNLLKFHYKDVDDAVIWVAEVITESLQQMLDEYGKEKRREGRIYFDFYKAIYGADIYGEEQNNVDVFHKRKEGKRDIQFLEWLEWKYKCNFVTRISREFMEVVDCHGAAYGCSTQKEIFPILDHCHCIPQEEDSIFDFGCGKGGALVSFLDYGFKRVGGVEYEPKIFDVLKDNMYKLGLENKTELIYGDAGDLTIELDQYNWFYFWQPFDATVLDKCMRAICDSYGRKSRKIYIIYIAPVYYESVERIGSKLFRLTNQFTVDMQSRVVNIYESYEI